MLMLYWKKRLWLIISLEASDLASNWALNYLIADELQASVVWIWLFVYSTSKASLCSRQFFSDSIGLAALHSSINLGLAFNIELYVYVLHQYINRTFYHFLVGIRMPRSKGHTYTYLLCIYLCSTFISWSWIIIELWDIACYYIVNSP